MPVDAELKRKKNKYIHVIIEVEEAEGEGNMSATGNKRKHGPVDICSNKFHFFLCWCAYCWRRKMGYCLRSLCLIYLALTLHDFGWLFKPKFFIIFLIGQCFKWRWCSGWPWATDTQVDQLGGRGQFMEIFETNCYRGACYWRRVRLVGWNRPGCGQVKESRGVICLPWVKEIWILQIQPIEVRSVVCII